LEGRVSCASCSSFPFFPFFFWFFSETPTFPLYEWPGAPFKTCENTVFPLFSPLPSPAQTRGQILSILGYKIFPLRLRPPPSLFFSFLHLVHSSANGGERDKNRPLTGLFTSSTGKRATFSPSFSFLYHRWPARGKKPQRFFRSYQVVQIRLENSSFSSPFFFFFSLALSSSNALILSLEA